MTRDELHAAARVKMLEAIEDLRDQVLRNEAHTLVYAAVAEDGTNVVTSLTNGSIRPVTMMGALVVLQHRLIETIAAGPNLEYSPGDGDGPDKPN